MAVWWFPGTAISDLLYFFTFNQYISPTPLNSWWKGRHPRVSSVKLILQPKQIQSVPKWSTYAELYMKNTEYRTLKKDSLFCAASVWENTQNSLRNCAMSCRLRNLISPSSSSSSASPLNNDCRNDSSDCTATARPHTLGPCLDHLTKWLMIVTSNDVTQCQLPVLDHVLWRVLYTPDWQ